MCREVPAWSDGFRRDLQQIRHILEFRAWDAVAHDERMSIELAAGVEVELIGRVQV